MKKLYKSNKNKVLVGVVGGIGEYFNIDPVILRIIWILLFTFSGFVPGIIAYLIAALIVPKRPK